MILVVLGIGSRSGQSQKLVFHCVFSFRYLFSNHEGLVKG